MRSFATIIVMIGATTLLLSAAYTARDDRFHRMLSPASLTLARGADGENPSTGIETCANVNLDEGQVPASDCEVADDICVLCNGDNVEGATTGVGATGPGFDLVGYTSCQGQLILGVCTPLPDDPSIVLCSPKAWDQKTYCSGEIDQALFQTPTSPGSGP